jgi:UDP-3-O-[3-hydroxymyristoyl] glucosamine N-acyltransferase
LKITTILDFDSTIKIINHKYLNFHKVGTIWSNDKGLISFVRDNEGQDLKYALNKKNIVALFVKEEDICDIDSDITFICCKNPYYDFHFFQQYLLENTNYFPTDQPNQISESAKIHPSVVFEGQNIHVGENSIVGPNCTLYQNTCIGNNVEIGAGCVIGSESLHIAYRNGQKKLISHVGGVTIDDDAYLGANNVIVRNVYETPNTHIGKSVSMANLVMVGHNVRIEDNVQVISNVVFGGGSVIKKGARVSFGSNIANYVVVGEKAWVTVGSTVTRDVPPGEKVSGNFAIPHKKQIEHVKRISQ